jgi:hypothetical protein
MMDFKGVTDAMLSAKLKEVGATSYAQILMEYVSRQINKCRNDLETANDLVIINILQGRIAQLRDLSRLLTSSPNLGAENPRSPE